MWNSDWRLEGAARGGKGATYLVGDVLVTFPRDTRPCMLQRTVTIAKGQSTLHLEIGSLARRPWTLQVFVDDDKIMNQIIGAAQTVVLRDVPPNAAFAVPNWTSLNADAREICRQGGAIEAVSMACAEQCCRLRLLAFGQLAMTN